MRLTGWVAGAVSLALAWPAMAQFRQYTAPGSLAVQEVPTKERLEKTMEAARWHFGGLRIAPWFGIRNATYYDDVLPDVPGKQSDLQITAGAGVGVFLPVGSRVVIAAHALPEYQWWRDLSSRRTWDGRYGAGAAAYFNRLTVEAFGSRTDEAQFATSESELPVDLRSDHGHATLELEILHGMFLFASADKTSWRYSGEGDGSLTPELKQLDRDETSASGGVRWELGRRFRVSFGAKRVDVDFLDVTFDRSSHGSAPTLSLLVGSDRAGLDASVAEFTIDPVGGSVFEPYHGTTGRFRVWRKVGSDSTWTLYGNRDIGFTALTEDAPYYVQQRVGASIAFALGWRGDAAFYAETGSLDYVGAPVGQRGRTDDLRAYGMSARFVIRRSASLFVMVTRTSYDSSVSGLDRTYTRIQTGLAFGSRDPAVW